MKALVKIDSRGRIVQITTEAAQSDISEFIDLGETGKTVDGYFFGDYFSTNDGIPVFKLDGVQVVQRTAAEIDADRAALPKPTPTDRERIETLEARQDDTDILLADMIGGAF